MEKPLGLDVLGGSFLFRCRSPFWVSEWLGKEGEEASMTSLDRSLSGAQGTIGNGQIPYSLQKSIPRTTS